MPTTEPAKDEWIGLKSDTSGGGKGLRKASPEVEADTKVCSKYFNMLHKKKIKTGYNMLLRTQKFVWRKCQISDPHITYDFIKFFCSVSGIVSLIWPKCWKI